MNKKITCLLALAGVLGGVSAVWAQGGFSGPKSGFVGPQVEPKAVSVEEAKNLNDEARVLIKGHVVSSLGDEDYMFKDDSGTIKVEIDNDLWKGVTIKPEDKVEILGEVDRHMQKETSIDAEAIAIVPAK